VPVKSKGKSRWEIEGAECGERFHRVFRGSKKDADEYEKKLRSNISKVKRLGHIPEVPLSNAIDKYLKHEFHGKERKKLEGHAKALKAFVVGKTIKDVLSVANEVYQCRVSVHTNRAGEKKMVKLTNSTVNRRLAILRRVANLAYRKWHWLSEPLHEKIEMLPENPSRTVYLSRSELAGLLKAIPHREMRRAALVLAFTGMRKGELLRLKPEDVRGNTICLTETKTGSPRNVPVLPSIRFALKRLPFKFYHTSITHAVNRASGGKVRVHDLRHTTASLLIQAGVPLYTVGAILGHKSLQTTRRYAHLDTKSMEAAISKLTPTRQIHSEPKQRIGNA
jgi:integrase